MSTIYIIFCSIIIIAIHELTHYLVAILLKMPVKSINIGWGKRIYAIGKVNINAFFFFGGYVSFEDHWNPYEQGESHVLKFLVNDTILRMSAPLMDVVYFALVFKYQYIFSNDFIEGILLGWACLIVSNIAPVALHYDKTRPLLYTDGGVALQNIVHMYQIIKNSANSRSVGYEDLYKIRVSGIRWFHFVLIYFSGFVLRDLVVELLGLEISQVTLTLGYALWVCALSFAIARFKYLNQIEREI